MSEIGVVSARLIIGRISGALTSDAAAPSFGTGQGVNARYLPVHVPVHEEAEQFPACEFFARLPWLPPMDCEEIDVRISLCRA